MERRKEKRQRRASRRVEFDPGVVRLRGVVERVIGWVKSWDVFHNP